MIESWHSVTREIRRPNRATGCREQPRTSPTVSSRPRPDRTDAPDPIAYLGQRRNNARRDARDGLVVHAGDKAAFQHHLDPGSLRGAAGPPRRRRPTRSPRQHSRDPLGRHQSRQGRRVRPTATQRHRPGDGEHATFRSALLGIGLLPRWSTCLAVAPAAPRRIAGYRTVRSARQSRPVVQPATGGRPGEDAPRTGSADRLVAIGTPLRFVGPLS